MLLFLALTRNKNGSMVERMSDLEQHEHKYIFMLPEFFGFNAFNFFQTSCEALSAYLSDTLNPYILNVTTAAHFCSESLCQGNGRCVRKNNNSDDYLHISSESHQISRKAGKYVVTGTPSASDLTDWKSRFTCQCYEDRNCTTTMPSF